VRLLLPVLLTIDVTHRCQMCDLHFKFEEDRTKKLRSQSKRIGIADRQTDRQTLKWFLTVTRTNTHTNTTSRHTSVAIGSIYTLCVYDAT